MSVIDVFTFDRIKVQLLVTEKANLFFQKRTFDAMALINMGFWLIVSLILLLS